MKRLIGIVLVLVMAGFAYQAYGRYQDKQELEFVADKMRSASNRVINLASFFKTPGGETYREVLAYGDDSLQEMSAAVLAIQSIKSPRKPGITEHAASYLKSCQASVRFIQKVVRAKIDAEVHGNAAGKMANTLHRYVDNPDSARTKAQADIAMYQVDDVLSNAKAAVRQFESASSELQEQLIELVSIQPPEGSGLTKDLYVPAEKVDGMSFTINLKPRD